ncbi:16S rRNA (guanine(966)-N(2))-methyltransferase RsmD [Cohnella sp. CFH 77786]|uniref:16S rRNA (guanine(966)-N(2))-methyltransferase RsmD n=1 Tax=Cohnella sp. CFH 77786 TaxID=2662265 RepID=UPI001C608D42|nr:16S rRNA (guanine(966)-N(2))-methyltransferase RsmD [Cohnella sp. CFH 77786]
MRVISGQAKGRPLKAVPGNTTRPTTDKVKEALFSMIGPYFDGERVLDLFAGTGGLGIEALSRGAGHAVFVDANPRSVEVVRRNLDAVKMAGQAEVYRNDARKAIKALERAGVPFDLIFLDPPYAMEDCDALLLELEERGLTADGAVAVIEHAARVDYPDRIGGFARTRLSAYGETALSIYRCRGEREASEPISEPEQTPEGGTEP